MRRLIFTFLLAVAATASYAGPAAVAPKKPGYTLADFKALVPQNAEGNFLMEVPRILNSASDREAQAVLAGQPVETMGMVLVGKNEETGGKRLSIIRSEMVCCNTHSRKCAVALEFAEKVPSFMPMSWVKLKGRLAYQQKGEVMVAVILVDQIGPTRKPANAMLR